MKIALVYPVPADALDLFKPDIQRFADTLAAYPTGHPFSLILVLSGVHDGCYTQATEAASRVFGFEAMRQALYYTGNGCDLGSHQHAAYSIDADLMVCLSTRVYFHRAGWLKRLVDAAKGMPGGIYGPMGCYERSPHIRTCCYAMAPKDFRDYPHLINSRENTFKFESGQWSISKWFKDLGRPVRMVDWESHYGEPAWRAGHLQNIYRRGDQSNCLVHDRHTEIYAQATPDRKRELERYAGDK